MQVWRKHEYYVTMCMHEYYGSFCRVIVMTN
jgi:hypothetical protein